MFEDRVKDLETRIKNIEHKLSESSKKTKESLEKDLKTAKSKPMNLSMNCPKLPKKLRIPWRRNSRKSKLLLKEWRRN
jgi:hypothetical protein